MPPPRDRLAAMQQNAYMEEGEDFNIPVDDEADGPLKDFFKEIEEIRDNCERVNQKVGEVKMLQNTILSRNHYNYYVRQLKQYISVF